MDFNAFKLTLINTNARSLRPKVKSLIDNIQELEATFAVVTETWFSEGTQLERETENLLLGSGLSMLTRNRELSETAVSAEPTVGYAPQNAIFSQIACSQRVFRFLASQVMRNS